MDIKQIKVIAIKLRELLRKDNIRTDLIILYGSYAKKTSKKNSDIDIAVVSRDFGRDRFSEGSRLNYLASFIDPRLEIVPIGLNEYLSNKSISPILNEIIKNGTPLI
jgi:predicted nucleotidyltransferase